MNELKTFNNIEFGEIRVSVEDGIEWFNANDVCEALDYKNSREALRKHVDADDVTKRDAIVNTGLGDYQTEINYINESGLYSLIFGSKLEKAKKFKRWITSEVLPSIRKHGAYAPTNLSSLDTLKLLVNSLEQQDNRLNIMEGKIETVKEIITEDEFDWREDTKKKIKHIAYVTGGEYKKTYDNIYLKLESDGRCNLKIRQDNMKRRYEKAGKRLAEINKVSKLDVIGEDPVLKNLFVKIVNVEYARVNL